MKNIKKKSIKNAVVKTGEILKEVERLQKLEKTKDKTKAVFKSLNIMFGCNNMQEYTKGFFKMVDEVIKPKPNKKALEMIVSMGKLFKEHENMIKVYYQLDDKQLFRGRIGKYIQNEIAKIDSIKDVNKLNGIIERLKEKLVGMKEEIKEALKRQMLLNYLDNKNSGLRRELKVRFTKLIGNRHIAGFEQVISWQNKAINEAILKERIIIANPSTDLSVYRLILRRYQFKVYTGYLLKRTWKNSRKNFENIVQEEVVNKLQDEHEMSRKKYKNIGGKEETLKKHHKKLKKLAKEQDRKNYSPRFLWNGWLKAKMHDADLLREHISIYKLEIKKIKEAKQKPGKKEKEKAALKKRVPVGVTAKILGNNFVFEITPRGKRLNLQQVENIRKKLRLSFKQAWMTVNMDAGDIKFRKKRRLDFNVALKSIIGKTLADMKYINLDRLNVPTFDKPLFKANVVGFSGFENYSGATSEALNYNKDLAKRRAANVAKNLGLPRESIVEKAVVLGIDERGNQMEVSTVDQLRRSWRSLLNLYRADRNINNNPDLLKQAKNVKDIIELTRKFNNNSKDIDPLQAVFFRRYLPVCRKAQVFVVPPKQFAVNVRIEKPLPLSKKIAFKGGKLKRTSV